jgi:hypothetical protein
LRAFPYLHRHPELVKPQLPTTIFASQVLRPVIGILLYVVAAALGWFIHPLVAVGIFISVVGYYAGLARAPIRANQPVDICSTVQAR